MSALDVFTYADQQVRTVIVDGEPWFVARDVSDVLGLTNSRMAVSRLDADGVSTTDLIDSLGRKQAASIVNEAGLYELIFQSRRPEARGFKRWVTHEVLPQIRRTGRFEQVEPEQALPQSYADALRQLAAQVEAREQLEAKAVEDAPKVAAWDEIASAGGDFEVADAAKMLARAGVDTGRQRLFGQLEGFGWIYRDPAGKWKARQSAVDAGYLAEKPQSHHHPRTGEVVLDPPQVRVTLRGVERLRVRLGSLVPT